jgi:pimeloyl-ACP methyl ester carboxylesterase
VSITEVTVGDVRIRVWAEGHGSPLLYLHGYEQHPGAAEFLKELSVRHTVIAPELPGYGDSTGGEHIGDCLDVVLRYRELLEQQSVGPVDIVGHCLGGMFAAELSAIDPHLVRKLVLVNPFGIWLDDLPLADPFTMSEEQLRTAKWHDQVGYADREPSILPIDSEPSERNAFRARNLAMATKFMWPLPDRGLRKRLRFVQAPTLVVHGISDGLVPTRYSEEFVRLIPDAQLCVLPQAGHLPMVERPDEFLHAVGGFLDS